LWELSESSALEASGKRAEEAEYLQSMQNAMQERSAWKPMEDNATDTAYIKKLKARINQIVEQELTFVDFKNQVNKEELAADTFNEVI
jgi:DNA relaxase NicK